MFKAFANLIADPMMNFVKFRFAASALSSSKPLQSNTAGAVEYYR